VLEKSMISSKVEVKCFYEYKIRCVQSNQASFI